jgi:hypothetical protein
MGKMMIAYINLNYLYWFTADLIDEISDEAVSRELKKINLPFNETHLVISIIGESHVNVLANTVDKIISYDFNKVTLIISSNIRKTYSQLLSSNILKKCEIIPINGWLFYCIRDLQRRNIQCSSWNWFNEKGYFPTGSLARANRIGFLKQLYDLDLLDNITWTFPSAAEQKSQILHYFAHSPGGIPADFEDFFDYCNKNRFVDLGSISTFNYGHHYVTEFIVGYYPLSNFTILSETPDGSITEKTWMTILNRHPFIMLATSRFLFDELKESGFKTFNNYLPYPEYATVDDLETRWEQTIENIRVFPKILQDRREEISADIEHNYNLCISLNSQIIKQFKEISPDIFNEPRFLERRDIAVDLEGDLYNDYRKKEKSLIEEKENKVFIEKYNIIKAEQWPKIHNRTEFYALSEEIKRECREVFNFPWPTLKDFIS